MIPLAPPPPGNRSRDRSFDRPAPQAFWIGLFLFLATLLVYLQVVGFGFVSFDDPSYLTANDQVKRGLSIETVRWAFTTGETGNWAPLVWLSYATDITLFGLNPGALHLVNALVHALNAVLWFRLMQTLTGDAWSSALVAALFALHPLHVESVAWISERKDVLSCLFWILTTQAYIHHVRTSSRRWFYCSLGFFALGLMTKAMLVTLPFILILLDHWPLGRLNGPDRPLRAWAARCLEKWPFFLLSLASGVVTFLVQRSEGAVSSLSELPLHFRIINVPLSYLRYLAKLFWPLDLAPFYPFQAKGLSVGVGAAALLALLAITAAVLRWGRNRPYLVTGWGWYLITLLPVIGLVQVGAQSHADRYTYIPLMGPFFVLVWGWKELAARLRIPQGVSLVFWGFILCLLAALSARQVSRWRDDLTLFQHTLAVTQNNALAHSSLAQALRQQGRYAEAAEHYAKAVLIQPKAHLYHFHLGDCLERLGRRGDAVTCFRRSLSLAPDYLLAHYRLGNLLAAGGEGREAVEHYRRVSAADPSRIMQEQSTAMAVLLAARINLGAVSRSLGNLEESRQALTLAVATDAKAWRAWGELAVTQAALGARGEARASLDSAILFSPDRPALETYLRQTSQSDPRLSSEIEALLASTRSDGRPVATPVPGAPDGR